MGSWCGVKARYIDNLVNASVKRKIELERAEERKVQREREAEGSLFDDKEAFVTEAYKEKQKELKRLEEEEKKREGSYIFLSIFYIVHQNSNHGC
jgi:coiled-coil domain-containing protein 55